MDAVVDSTVERWFTPAFLDSQANAAMIDLVGNMIATTSVAGYCGCAAALMGLSYGSRLSEMAVPVLYVAGAEDPAAPPDAMSQMAAATPDAELAVVEHAAHLLNLEQPEAFARSIGSWLDKTAAA